MQHGIGDGEVEIVLDRQTGPPDLHPPAHAHVLTQRQQGRLGARRQHQDGPLLDETGVSQHHARATSHEREVHEAPAVVRRLPEVEAERLAEGHQAPEVTDLEPVVVVGDDEAATAQRLGNRLDQPVEEREPRPWTLTDGPGRQAGRGLVEGPQAHDRARPQWAQQPGQAVRVARAVDRHQRRVTNLDTLRRQAQPAGVHELGPRHDSFGKLAEKRVHAAILAPGLAAPVGRVSLASGGTRGRRKGNTPGAPPAPRGVRTALTGWGRRGPTPSLPPCVDPGRRGRRTPCRPVADGPMTQPRGTASFCPSAMVAVGSELSSWMR